MDTNQKSFYQKTWFIWLTLVIFFPVGLFLLWRFSSYSTKTKGIISGIFLLLILIGSFSDDKTKITPQPLKQEETKPASVEQTPIYTIGLTPEEFKAKFNAQSSESGLTINTLETESGEKQNAFKYAFSKNLALAASVNKVDGSIRDISIIAQPVKDRNQNFNIFLSFGYLIQAINPELKPDDRGQMLRELGLLDKNLDVTKLDNRIIRGNNEYHVSFIEGIGFLFNVKNKDDK